VCLRLGVVAEQRKEGNQRHHEWRLKVHLHERVACIQNEEQQQPEHDQATEPIRSRESEPECRDESSHPRSKEQE
jgi:hypothetical protein